MSRQTLVTIIVLTSSAFAAYLRSKRRKCKSVSRDIRPPYSKQDVEDFVETIGQEIPENATFSRDGRLAREVNSLSLGEMSDLGKNVAFCTRLLHSLIGEPACIDTCFGSKRTVYCDWTGSAKASSLVEDYLERQVLPMYANTHSLESRMGLQTSCFREEAREIVQLACNANRKKDAVIFTGNGSTGAIQKIIDVLGLIGSNDSNSRGCVVFLGAHEHTSNLVLWRETRAKVVLIPEREDGSGRLDISFLSKALKTFGEYKLKIGSFSACSNVTGIIEDVDSVTVELHKGGALAFWDYASAAPYVPIDMNPVGVGLDRGFLHKDGVFISSHKFVGGVGGPGILIAKKNLFNNAIPHGGGGGTVYFVDESGHRYLSDVVSREEGGTPNIVGAVRAGLAFKLKHNVGLQTIRDREHAIVQRIRFRLKGIEDLVVVGPMMSKEDVQVLPVVSFVIRAGGRFLHHNFVVALLSDLFGIQARGGCLCAGPYVQSLLGISKQDVLSLEEFLVASVHEREQYRPGVTRISIPYFFDDERIDYVLDSLCAIAKFGWKLLPLYRYENISGEWGFRRNFQKFPERVWLADFLAEKQGENNVAPVIASNLQAQLDLALIILTKPPEDAFRVDRCIEVVNDRLRWFLEPWEASALLRNEELVVIDNLLIEPERYLQTLNSQRDRLSEQMTIPNGAQAPSCPLPRSSHRDAKQPKRFAMPNATITENEQELALSVTTEKVNLAMVQMSESELFPAVPPRIMRLVVQASKEWSMINPGDRLLLGLSGGKDSLCLLHVLLQIQKRAPFRFEIACCTIDPGAGDAFNPSPLIPYVKSLGIQYHFEPTDIFESARETLGNAASYCSFCARMKRGALYRVARHHGYTALVLAQHLDDFVESFFMSAIRNGSLRTMKANYVESKGEVRIIRPLCYVRERDTKEFSYSARLPVINENCPACFSAPTERERVKHFLKDQERLIPSFFESMRKAIIPLMDGSIYSTLDAIQDRLSEQKGTNNATKDVSRNVNSKRQVSADITTSM